MPFSRGQTREFFRVPGGGGRIAEVAMDFIEVAQHGRDEARVPRLAGQVQRLPGRRQRPGGVSQLEGAFAEVGMQPGRRRASRERGTPGELFRQPPGLLVVAPLHERFGPRQTLRREGPTQETLEEAYEVHHDLRATSSIPATSRRVVSLADSPRNMLASSPSRSSSASGAICVVVRPLVFVLRIDQ